MRTLLIIILFVSFFIRANILIHTSKYIDGVNNKLLENASIIVNEDGRIESIQKGFIPQQGYTYYDLRNYTVMPGLMDMHVHFGQEYVSKADAPVKEEKEYSAIRAVQHAKLTLDGGFTTVRQVGDSGFIAISLIDAIRAVSYTHMTLPTIYSV